MYNSECTLVFPVFHIIQSCWPLGIFEKLQKPICVLTIVGFRSVYSCEFITACELVYNATNFAW